MLTFLSLFFGTFVLEDVALATGVALWSQGQISLALAFLACFLGISIGDILLYGLGRGAFGLGNKFLRARFGAWLQKIEHWSKQEKFKSRMGHLIVVSRVLPGARLPTYLVAGFTRYSLRAFCGLTVLSVFVWVLFAFAIGKSLGQLLGQLSPRGSWTQILVFLGVFLVLLRPLKNILSGLAEPWSRKAFVHRWRRWLHFEFWPALLFYLPIIPLYIFLSVKYRSFLAPFYANPSLLNGGLIGESKWDFLQFLKPEQSSTLQAVLLPKNADEAEALAEMGKAGLSFPLIIKPDVGQRGFGVRILRSPLELKNYLAEAQFPCILQKLSSYSLEAGVFYVRSPNVAFGRVISLTLKEFPEVIGDGLHKIGDLILQDARARIIAKVYFDRLSHRLEEVLPLGEAVALSECGNHCQGAIFLNGESVITAELEKSIDNLAKSIPEFYFGRLDIRFESIDGLRAGRAFEVMEVNGAGSECTHIWDPSTTLGQAYQTLFRQWDLLFAIGNVNRLRKVQSHVHIGQFLAESFRVFFREHSLSISD
jgi:membrane protein DedA with SNARE-associated domain